MPPETPASLKSYASMIYNAISNSESVFSRPKSITSMIALVSSADTLDSYWFKLPNDATASSQLSPE